MHVTSLDLAKVALCVPSRSGTANINHSYSCVEPTETQGYKIGPS